MVVCWKEFNKRETPMKNSFTMVNMLPSTRKKGLILEDIVALVLSVRGMASPTRALRP
jgi:hypothetical protein